MTDEIEIREATQDDKDWIKDVWENSGAQLGPFGMAWYFYWKKDPKKLEYWDVVEPYGFVHWTIRKRDGRKRVAEIAVSQDARRMGVGKRLMEHVGRPVYLKTDLDNDTSRAFYRRLGLQETDVIWTRNKKKQMVVFEGE